MGFFKQMRYAKQLHTIQQYGYELHGHFMDRLRAYRDADLLNEWTFNRFEERAGKALVFSNDHLMDFPDVFTKEQLANFPADLKERADALLQNVAEVAQKQHP